MKSVNKFSDIGRAAVMLCALLAAPGAHAQDAAVPAADAPSDGDDVIAPITLENSRHAGNPLFDDDVPDVIEAPPAPPETSRERFIRMFTLYKDAIAEGSYAEADTIGKQIVEMTIEEHGRNSEEAAHALTNLAIAQHGLGDYESAQLNFSASIDIIENVRNRLDEGLINPLKGLGASQLAAGQPDLASETFQRAVHVSHVNEGPHNLMQVELLESLAETYLAGGEVDLTVDMYERIFNLQARNIDEDSEDLLPALRNRARWQHRLQMYEKERYTWRRIISILEDNRGRDDLSLIAPLTGLAQSYLFIAPPEFTYQQPTANSTGEIYLKRALRIAEDNPESDWRIESNAILELADYYLLTDRPNRAERVYRDAWELLSADKERLLARSDKLQSLQVLQAIQPPKFYGLDAGAVLPKQVDGYETGTVVYAYSISPRGRATDIELVDMQPSGLDDMQNSVGRELRHLVQRPRMVDGDAVTTDRLTYTHNFYYRERDLPEPVEDGESLADSSRP